MQLSSRSDQDLLGATDALSFEEFYLRHVNTLLGYFARRTGDAELAADLASETFAAALAGRRGYKPRKGAPGAWLFGIASRKLADAQRKGYAERRMCRKLGMERIELTDADIAHIEELGESGLLEGLPEAQAAAVRAHVIEETRLRRDRRRAAHERGGGAQAGQPRAGHGAPQDREAPMSQDFTTRLQLQLREAALREEQRGALGRRLAGLRYGMPAPAATVAVGLAALLVAVLIAVGGLRWGGQEDIVSNPKVIGNVPLAENLGFIASGFGSVWVADADRQVLLRVNPKTRAVEAEIRTGGDSNAVGGDPMVNTGAGAVWAIARAPEHRRRPSASCASTRRRTASPRA